MMPPPPPPPRRRRARAGAFPTFAERRLAAYKAADKQDDDWVQQRYRDKHRQDKAAKGFSKRRTVQRRHRERRARAALDKEMKALLAITKKEHWADRFADYAYAEDEPRHWPTDEPTLPCPDKEERHDWWRSWGCECSGCIRS